MKGLPTQVTLWYASRKNGKAKKGQHAFEVPPEEVVVVFNFSESGFGFGEIAIKQTKDGVFIDTECMGKDAVKRYLGMLVDSAITDHDKDPVKHGRYSKAMGRSCGPACSACFPEFVCVGPKPRCGKCKGCKNVKKAFGDK